MLPAGVSVVGQPAALTYGNGKTGGSIVLARPASMREPLFHITWGVTLRGMHILYDTMPYPSNADFANKSSRFYYPSYADVRSAVYCIHMARGRCPPSSTCLHAMQAPSCALAG